jgi:hypothetical protein
VQCVPVDFHFGVIWRVLLRVGICGSDVIGSWVRVVDEIGWRW